MRCPVDSHIEEELIFWFSPKTVRSVLAQRLNPPRKLWISKLRHGEHPWQQVISNTPTNQTLQTSDVYDAGSAQASSRAHVRRALELADVDFVELPDRTLFQPKIAVPLLSLQRPWPQSRSDSPVPGLTRPGAFVWWTAEAVRSLPHIRRSPSTTLLRSVACATVLPPMTGS